MTATLEEPVRLPPQLSFDVGAQRPSKTDSEGFVTTTREHKLTLDG